MITPLLLVATLIVLFCLLFINIRTLILYIIVFISLTSLVLIIYVITHFVIKFW